MERAETVLRSEPVWIRSGKLRLNGDLFVPENAAGIVLFVHGSGSSRFSPRNQKVARFLQERNLATLLFDLSTLFIVGGNDDQVIQLNVQAMQKIQCEKRLEIIPGATHLFEEAGALDQVGRFARSWFQRYLC
jgi:alpha/beta superfamily hydrolase